MTSFMPRVAKLINRLRFIAQYDQERQRLYKLDFPIKYEVVDPKTFERHQRSTYYVLCSNSIAGHCAPETMLFPANWRGRMKSAGEIGLAYPWDQDVEVLAQIEASILKLKR